ncbi:hypothetical protein HZA44_04725 [Candidatus Peregrinibacteria bacterium]|nr:hypothetical protein [Candidatus Peregrinibacteria bacterium]
MASREKQSGADPLFDESHPLFDELMEIADEENMTVSRLREVLNKCLTLGIEDKTPEEVMHAREQFSKFIDIVEHKRVTKERKILEGEGRLIELGKHLKPSDSKGAPGAMATVTPLFEKKEEEAPVEPVVVAKSTERPRAHLRLIK